MASADVGDELTVLCQVTRCLTSQALENQDGDLEVDTSAYGSQWSCRSIGVMWSRRDALVISRAAAFCTDYRRVISLSGKPYDIALQ